MTKKDYIKYWQEMANEDYKTAETLFSAKRFHHALFFCQLAIEKHIKGLIYANTGQHALPIHDLSKLAKQANLKLNKIQEKKLEEITTWNIRARYDDYKRVFYKKATREFTSEWMEKVKRIILWLKNQY